MSKLSMQFSFQKYIDIFFKNFKEKMLDFLYKYLENVTILYVCHLLLDHVHSQEYHSLDISLCHMSFYNNIFIPNSVAQEEMFKKFEVLNMIWSYPVWFRKKPKARFEENPARFRATAGLRRASIFLKNLVQPKIRKI